VRLFATFACKGCNSDRWLSYVSCDSGRWLSVSRGQSLEVRVAVVA
jgi:hypothetical protein